MKDASAAARLHFCLLPFASCLLPLLALVRRLVRALDACGPFDLLDAAFDRADHGTGSRADQNVAGDVFGLAEKLARHALLRGLLPAALLRAALLRAALFLGPAFFSAALLRAALARGLLSAALRGGLLGRRPL